MPSLSDVRLLQTQGRMMTLLEKLAEARKLRDKGYNNAYIARQVNLHESAIRRYLAA